jgi:hypothetical protein
VLVAVFEATVASLAELCRMLDAADLAALNDLVDAENEVDTWVEAEDDGIEIRCDTVGTSLAFPFTLSDFWEVVRETEDDEVRRWELDES